MLVLFIVILLFNIYFILVWTYRFLDVLLRTYVDRLRGYRCLQFLKEREVDNYDEDLRKVMERHNSQTDKAVQIEVPIKLNITLVATNTLRA